MTAIKRPAGRPRTDKPLKTRAVRIDDDTWQAAQARARADGLSMGEVLRHYLHAYADGGRS